MNTQQSKALRLAKGNENRARAFLESSDAHKFHKDTAAELRRLHQVDLACQEWLDKTEWVQASSQASELGQHRADVIKQRLDLVTGQRDELLVALRSVWLWMEDQADGQSKGGHATFDLMLLREQRDISGAAIAKAGGAT